VTGAPVRRRTWLPVRSCIGWAVQLWTEFPVRRRRAAGALVLALGLAVSVSGCFDVSLGDLFLLTRTGQGTTLRLLVYEGGFMGCNGHKQKTISSAMLIQARDLSDDLSTDATDKLTIPPSAHSVYYFRIKLQQGTVSFPDSAGATHPTLAQAELFATQAAQSVCGLSG
jgi:hypothetical protein